MNIHCILVGKYVDDFVIKVGRDMTIYSSQEILGITVDQCILEQYNVLAM
jgi:hypothetical protein